MINGRKFFGAHYHSIVPEQTVGKRVIEELASTIGLDELPPIMFFQFFNADLPRIIVKFHHPVRRAYAVPPLGTERLEEINHMIDGGGLEFLRPCEVNAARAYIISEF